MFNPPHYLVFFSYAANIVLFGLCWAGALDQAFKKRLLNFTPERWRLTYQATLVLGIINVIFKHYGEMVGVPSMVGKPHLLNIVLDFLPFVLFAIPVIVHEHELKKE